MSAHHGKNGALYMSVSGTGPLAYVGQVSEFSLDMAVDTVETSALGAKNKTYVQGLPDIKGTFTAFWNEVDDALFDAADSPDGCKIALYPSLLQPARYWAGPAWVSASLKSGISAAVTVDGTFMANGAWIRA
jgi:hypothetical protein